MSQVNVTVYETDLGADNKQENAIDTVTRKLRSDWDSNEYVRYQNEFYYAYGYGDNRVIFLDTPHEPVKRYRKVFSSQAEVAHAWAHHLDSDEFGDEGRSGNGRVFYDGRSIYSYGYHFEIARILTDIPGQEQPVVLFNNATYSNSTSGHQSHVRSAIPHDWTVIKINPYKIHPNSSRYGKSPASLFEYGPNNEMKDTYRSIINWICDEIENARDYATRTRAIWSLKSTIKTVKGLQSKARTFIDIFQCKSVVLKSQWDIINKPVFDTKKEFWEKARQVIGYKFDKRKRTNTNRIAALREANVDFDPDKLSDREIEKLFYLEKKRVKAYEALNKINKYKENVSQWKKGEDIHHSFLPSIPWDMTKKEIEELTGTTLNGLAPVYVRKHPRLSDTIQTSKGATIRVKDLKLAWELFQRYGKKAMEKSTGPDDFVHFNGKVKLGGYTSVPAVNSVGTFRFGCHKIIESEREYILTEMGIK